VTGWAEIEGNAEHPIVYRHSNALGATTKDLTMADFGVIHFGGYGIGKIMLSPQREVAHPYNGTRGHHHDFCYQRLMLSYDSWRLIT